MSLISILHLTLPSFAPFPIRWSQYSCDLFLPSRSTRSTRFAQTFGPNLKRQGADKSKRRRDELREGFRRLKEVLPATTQRSSKSSLLDRCESTSFSIPTDVFPFDHTSLRYEVFHPTEITPSLPIFVPSLRSLRERELIISGSPYSIDRSGESIPTSTI